VVDDEFGCPTSTADLATAILALRDVPPGTYHLAGGDVLSRHAWASDLVARHAPGVAVEAIDSSQFSRPSTPPPWGVLDGSLARSHGLSVRGWSEARADYSAPEAG
jgi:dTDP-4-dehydrorhamnose reductase